MKQKKTTLPEARVTDSLIQAIGSRLAVHEPERGGALLGFGGTAHVLVEDDFGGYGRAFWDISPELSDAVGVLENRGHGQFIGTVHTHPAGVCDPSGQDRETMTRALELNPHLSELLVCVVTKGVPRETDVAVPGGHRMSIHLIRRGPSGSVEFVRAQPVVVSLAELLKGAERPVPSVSVSEVQRGELDGLAPVLQVGGTERLVVRITGTDDAWFVSPAGVVEQTTSAESATDRVVELTGSMAGRHVLVAGAGSVGSRIAEDLVRSGVERFTLIDPDVVSLPNMARSVYVRTDIGTPKVYALSSRLRAINPSAEVLTVQRTLLEADVDELLDGVDLAVLATDDMAQQAHLAGIAYGKGVMQVASALYRRAAAGEAVMVVPEADTPCWACAVGTSALSASERPDTNYGVDGRLVAESGLGASINLVASAASLMAVGLLAGPASAAGAPLARLVAESRTMGIIATTPRWSLFADVFEGMSHQSHPQSIWPRLRSVEGCPVCAPVVPDDVMTGAEVSLSDLLTSTKEACGPEELGTDGPPVGRELSLR